MSPTSKSRSIKKSAKPVPTPVPPLAMYRKLAVSFVVVVAVLLAVVIYVSTSRAIITIMPVEKPVSADFILDVVKTPTRDTHIRGRVAAVTVGKQKSFEPSGQGMKEVEAKSAGRVVIKNTTSKSQALVKTTRLLSADGVLFRLDASVDVPANGQVEAGVHADQVGATGDITPTKFTIPGLSATLQPLIYAESAEPFTGGVARVSVLTQEELDGSFEVLQNELREDARILLRQEVGDVFGGETLYVNVKDQSADAKAGDEIKGYALTMTAEVAGVFYDQTALAELSQLYLYDQLTQGMEYKKTTESLTQATVEKYDVSAGTASMKVHVAGTAVPSLTHTDLQAGNFAGMSKTQVQEYFLGRNLAESVDVRLSPFWSTGVPSLKDHIYIEIK